MPDLYPLVPGHVLVTSKEHLPCLGAADAATMAELDEVVPEATAFVRDAYGVEPVGWENGVVGQTVFHAHLHLIPVDIHGGMLDELVADEASVEIHDWEAVAARFREAGQYHYIKVRNRAWLVEGNGAMNWEGRRRLAIAAGLAPGGNLLKRPQGDADIAELAARYRGWAGSR
jgi:diadenosine tetraphosphate (Ap4A) HIT family hydrolase